jgi:hypothetical protein
MDLLAHLTLESWESYLVWQTQQIALPIAALL